MLTDLVVPSFKMEYDYGFISKDDVASWVRQGIITAANYLEITGERYG